MAFSSIDFAVFLAVSAISLSMTRVLWLRMSMILLFNLYFLCSFAAGSFSLVPLAVFIVSGYLLHRWVLLSERFFPPAIITIILMFLLLKKYTIVPDIGFLNIAYSTVGMSYILFRSLQVIYDSKVGLIKELTLFEYVVFATYFPALVSGPIQRFQDFRKELNNMAEVGNPRNYNENILRIFKGFFKIILVSSMLNNLRLALLNYGFTDAPGPIVSVMVYTGCSLSYLLYLYYNFAGYMDVVIGWSALYGIGLPENFNKPFAAKNFLEFWSRWHITLSEWFKIYLFNPLLKGLMTSQCFKGFSPNTLAILAFCTTFFIMGVWHGSTFLFVVYGLFLGAGVSLNKTYQILLTKQIGKKRYKELCESPLYSYLARGMTVAYFSASLICLWWWKKASFLSGDMHVILLVFLGFIFKSVLLAGYYFVFDKTAIKIHSLCRFDLIKTRYLLNDVGLALTLTALAAVVFVSSKNVPDFIYKAF